MLWLFRLPLFLQITVVAAMGMLIPAVYAARIGDLATTQAFGNSSLLGFVLVALVGIALETRQHRSSAMGQLLQLLGAFLILPVYLALPFHVVSPSPSFGDSYLEMTSAMTTTGLVLFPAESLSASAHLWRAIVAWLGGMLMWVAAAAVLAPVALGGFELLQGARQGRLEATGALRGATLDPSRRVTRATRAMAPLYTCLTAILALALYAAGEDGIVAVCHAMSVLATSGITPLVSMADSKAGVLGEILLLLFVLPALSRVVIATPLFKLRPHHLTRNIELRLALLFVVVVPLLLFFRHWIGTLDTDFLGPQVDESPGVALRALWGGIFTTVSFLSTTGFESADWQTAQAWSGLGTPGIILMGLALVGGGVATTAGGVKLLRVYALYLNGLREVERLVHPSSVTGESALDGRVRRDGQVIAWVFFMLVAVALAVVTIGLGAMGVDFENAILLAVACLTNTGPLIVSASEAPIALIGASIWVKLWLAAAMILGRLELLAIIVLLVPGSWRD